MRAKTRLWLRSLVAAIITGSATSMTGTVGATLIAPESFNTAAMLDNLVQFSIFQLLFGGLIGLFAYLKQSPLPPPETADLPFVRPPGGPLA